MLGPQGLAPATPQRPLRQANTARYRTSVEMGITMPCTRTTRIMTMVTSLEQVLVRAQLEPA